MPMPRTFAPRPGRPSWMTGCEYLVVVQDGAAVDVSGVRTPTPTGVAVDGDCLAPALPAPHQVALSPDLDWSAEPVLSCHFCMWWRAGQVNAPTWVGKPSSNAISCLAPVLFSTWSQSVVGRVRFGDGTFTTVGAGVLSSPKPLDGEWFHLDAVFRLAGTGNRDWEVLHWRNGGALAPTLGSLAKDVYGLVPDPGLVAPSFPGVVATLGAVCCGCWRRELTRAEAAEVANTYRPAGATPI